MARGRSRSGGSRDLHIQPGSPLARALARCSDCNQNSPDGLIGGRCPSCQEVRNADIERLRAYIAEHGVKPAWELTKALGIDSRLVLDYLNTARRGAPSFSEQWREMQKPVGETLRRDPERMPDQSPMHHRRGR